MPFTISDEQLQTIGMSEHEAAIEFACRLFDVGKITFHAAMKLAAVDRLAFEDALRARGIAIYRPDPEELRREVEALKRSGV
jgi:predicted HTH domain antitoxin